MKLLRQIGVPPRHAVLLAAATPALLAATALLLPLCIGVWLPDLWTGPKTLAETRTPSGHRFRVVQTWGSDFYTTELIHTLPSGDERRGLIDGDDHKLWKASLIFDEARQRVTIDGTSYRRPRAGGEDLRLILGLDGTVLSGLRSDQ